MTEQPKSECKCIDCNLPDVGIEKLGYKPTKSSRATEEETTPIIEPKTKGKNSEVAGQPLEQPENGIHVPIFVPNCLIKHLPEQPNTELLIVKTIQSLMTCVTNELNKLEKNTEFPHNSLVFQALEDVELFEKTTLYKLYKRHENNGQTNKISER